MAAGSQGSVQQCRLSRMSSCCRGECAKRTLRDTLPQWKFNQIKNRSLGCGFEADSNPSPIIRVDLKCQPFDRFSVVWIRYFLCFCPRQNSATFTACDVERSTVFVADDCERIGIAEQVSKQTLRSSIVLFKNCQMPFLLCPSPRPVRCRYQAGACEDRPIRWLRNGVYELVDR